MPTFSELLNYVSNARKQGIADEIIRNNLLGAGWSEANISEVLQSKIAVPSPTEKQNKSYTKVAVSLIVILVLLIATGYYFFNDFKSINQITKDNSSNQTSNVPVFTQDKIDAENNKTDLSTYFSKEKAPGLYLIPKMRDLSGTLISKEKVDRAGISFESSWGKLSAFTSINGNDTFKFGSDRSINFYRQDNSSALIKTLEQATTTEGWRYPKDYTEQLRSFMTENKISSLKDLINYSLAIDPQNILADTDYTKVIINYALLHQVKRSLVGNDITEIDRFKSQFLEGYVLMPSDNSAGSVVNYIIFTPGENIYSVSMWSKVPIAGADINTFLSSLAIQG